MNADPYSAEVRRRFFDPQHAGRVDGGTEARVDAQGLRIRLTMRASDGRIAALAFEASGCPHVVAACDAFCEAYEGRQVAELCGFTGALLMQQLAVPVEKTGRILVLEDAVRALGPAGRDT
ncbi:MAG: iron-sulfur cluster assembly scaffold protein [Woeseiaceae bacterium]|nr:iron-sulfur cluster assembly scaffold protein [Woeseiaceae bacterium]